MATKSVGAETFFVPLNMLDDDPNNPRRVGRHADVEGLAASIAAHTLLQPLGVVPHPEGEGRYMVRFGGRRLAALRLLAENKKIGRTAPVACRALAEKDAAEAALTENVNRVGMHPADEFLAFAELHKGGRGMAPERIAQRFGVTTHTVRQRLRLASVSPRLLDSFRDDTLTLDQVMAFAITDDAAAQEHVFATLPEYTRTPHAIRTRLTQGKVHARDRRAEFVGAAAYEAAGGTVIRDLFTEDSGGWFADAGLLDRLVVAKLGREAETVRGEGWAWVEPIAHLPADYHAQRRVWPEDVALSDEDEARLIELSERLESFEGEIGDADLSAEQDAEVDQIEREIAAIEAKREAFKPEDVARAGAFVMLGHDGLRIERGILRDDAPAAAEPGEGTAEDEDEGDGEEADEAEDDAAEEAPAAPSTIPPARSPLPGAVVAELLAQRTAGLQAAVAGNPHLALCLLLESLLTRYGTPCRVRVQEPTLHLPFGGSAADTPAGQRMGELGVKGQPEGRDLLPWLLDKDPADLLLILAPLVARGMDAGSVAWTDAARPEARAAQLAELDMRDWWKADAGSYFNHVSKAHILDAVREGAGETAAWRIEDLKKEPMAEAAAELLAGKGWLPPLLRVPAAAEAAEQGQDAADLPMAAE